MLTSSGDMMLKDGRMAGCNILAGCKPCRSTFQLLKSATQQALHSSITARYINKKLQEPLQAVTFETLKLIITYSQLIITMVGIIMGSDSDLAIMQDAATILQQFNVPFELTVVSAHRTPLRMVEYACTAASRGLKVIIAGAGGAAHLPGMVAAITTLPVIGVPVKSSNSIDGWDSILSILQMPNGVPVATVALNAAKNAGILAAQIIGTSNAEVTNALRQYKEELNSSVEEKIKKLQLHFPNEFDKNL